MNHAAENELFSAYLDGELTADEEAQVEQLLAASPAARQLMEEFRALSCALQSLPSEKLSEDLSSHVLREVEQRSLSEAPLPQTRSTRMAAHGLDWSTLISRLFRPRVVAWSALAVAVALMFTIHDFGRRDVATAPVDKVGTVASAPHVLHEVPTVDPARTDAKLAAPSRTALQPAQPVAVAIDTSASIKPKPRDSMVTSHENENRDDRPEPEAVLPIVASSPSSAGERGEPAPALAGKTTPPSQSPAVVRCDVHADVLKQGLLDTFLADQNIARQPALQADVGHDTPTIVGSGTTVQIRLKASSAQLSALLAQMKAHPEAFSSIAVQASPPLAESKAPSEPSGVAASVRVQWDVSQRPTMATPKSRVLFDRDVPPPTNPGPHSGDRVSVADADSHPVVLVLHILDSENPPSPVESEPAKH